MTLKQRKLSCKFGKYLVKVMRKNLKYVLCLLLIFINLFAELPVTKH